MLMIWGLETLKKLNDQAYADWLKQHPEAKVEAQEVAPEAEKGTIKPT